MNKKGQEFGVFAGIFVVLLFIGLVVALIGFDQVEANHLGVKVRLGQITGTMQPGMQWTGFLTKIYEYDMKIRKMQVIMNGSEGATDINGQAVYGTVSVNYRLKKSPDIVENLYSNVGEDEDISFILNIEPIIREGFKQATVQYESIEILQNRQEVKNLAKENIKNNFPQEYFEIVDIVVENIDFTPEYKKAIEDKQVAKQERLKEEEMIEVVKAQQQQEIEIYKAEAEKLRLQKSQVTQLLNEQKMIEKWDGELPATLIITPGTNGLFMNLAQGVQSYDDNEVEYVYNPETDDYEEVN